MKIFSRPLGLLALVAVCAGGTACGSDDKEASAEAPVIDHFEAHQQTVFPGGEVELHWSTRNAVEVRVVDGRDVPVPMGDAAPAEGAVTVRPVTSTSFRLLAIGSDGTTVSSERKAVEVVPFPAPTIVSFSVTPEEVAFAATAVLSWEITDAASIEIRDSFGRQVDLGDADPSEGSVEVTPRADMTFTLVATGRGGQKVTDSKPVRITQSPGITFGVDDRTIEHGASTRLTWSTERAEHVVIQPEGGEPIVDTDDELSGSFTVQPTKSTIYVLTASGKGGTEHATVSVSVAPKVHSFALGSAGPFRPGDDVTVSWDVSGAASITILNGNGGSYIAKATELARGSATIRLATTGYFELVARSGNAETRSHLAVELAPEPAVRIFTATPDRIPEGAATTLEWLIDGASEISIEARPDSLPTNGTGTNLAVGNLSPRKDRIDVLLLESTTFRLKAKAGLYTTTRDVRVEIR